MCVCLFHCQCVSVLNPATVSFLVRLFVRVFASLCSVCLRVCEGRCYCVSQFVCMRTSARMRTSACVYARADAARAPCCVYGRD